jgi:hypothetical protein
MALPTDVLVATTLARTAQSYMPPGNQPLDPHHTHHSAAAAGQQFERALFEGLQAAYPWEHCCGPDHFDMALDLTGKTGTHYEFDGAFLTQDNLYIVEAKRVDMLTRAHIGILVQKLFDVFLAPHDHLRGVDIKPVLVSAGAKVSPAAWTHALAWGVLLVTPQRVTPFEILGAIQMRSPRPASRPILSDCERLGKELWRPFNRLLLPAAPQSTLYQVASHRIYDLETCRDLLDLWNDCIVRASVQST